MGEDVPVGARRRRGTRGKVAFADEVASQLLTSSRRHAPRAPIRLEPIRIPIRRPIQEQLINPRLARRAGALGARPARGASMYERRALSVLIDVLEVDDERVRVVFRVGEHFCAVERDDVVCDCAEGLGGEVVVVDPEVGVEPVYLVRDELARDEALFGWLISSQLQLQGRDETWKSRKDATRSAQMQMGAQALTKMHRTDTQKRDPVRHTGPTCMHMMSLLRASETAFTEVQQRNNSPARRLSPGPSLSARPCP